MPLTAAEAAALAQDRRELARINDESLMLLIWLRHSFNHILQSSGHKLVGSLESRPVDRIITLLADGVILADIIASLAPSKLAPTAILRVAPRNALSAPSSRPPGAPAVSNVDARQRHVQYNTNTRRVLAAVKKLLEAVRTQAGIPTVPGVVDDFVGNAPAIPPAKDVRPALRLAQLVLAATVYAPDKTYRYVFWQLPADSIRNTFHKSLTSVAQAVDLPTPDTLYADGPPATQSPQSRSPNTTPQPASAAALSRTLPSGASAGAAAHAAPTAAGVVELSRKHDAEAFASPLIDDVALVHPSAMLDDGMGGRKISLVTDDENHSRGSISPPRVASSAMHVNLSASTTGQERHHIGKQNADERLVEDINQHDDQAGEYGDSHSDEFYTPQEHTPGEHSPSPAAEDASHNRSATASAQYAGTTSYRVNETVRESVTTSVMRQISVVPEFQESDTHQEPLSGEFSSLDLGTRDARASIEQRPIDFTNPAYFASPSGSDVPAPSNQWQIYHQKTTAAEVMSPQQLFSPPPMPRPFGDEPAVAELAPPQAAPTLFRNGSPQLSLSSAEGRAFEEGQPLSRNSRVSFAPTSKSSGLSSHRLARPARDPLNDSRGQPHETQQRSGSFALPPSASNDAIADSGRAEGAGEDLGDSAIEAAGQAADAEHRGSDRGEPEEDENLDAAYQYEHGGKGDHTQFDDGFDPDNEEVFEKVEEYAVNSSERADEDLGRVEGVRGTQVDQPELLQSSARRDVSQSPKRTTGSEGFGAVSADNRAGAASATGSEHSLEYGQESTHSDIFKQAEAMVAADAQYFTTDAMGEPPSTPRLASGYPTALQHREVPPTPPSPPTVAALVESFTARKHTAESIEARPVSTMAPSAGLFQKLIALWKSSEEGGEETRDRDSNPLDAGVTSIYRTEQNLSQSTTQDSTLPSGDTDLVPPKPPIHAESPRSRRRRAIRIDSGSHHNSHKGDLSTESGRLSADEKGSIASFSDAFSSDKERSFMYTGQGEGYDWDAAMKGDHTSGIPPSSSASQEHHKISSTREALSDTSREVAPGRSRPPLPPSPRTSRRKTKSSHSTSTQGRSVATDGNRIRVDRRHLDWLTRELLNARDMISRQELQMTFHETQRVEQEEVLLLDKENAESVVGAMKQILADREKELHEARNRLSVAIEGVGTTQDRSSLSSRNSVSADSQSLSKLITEGHAKLHTRIDESDMKSQGVANQMSEETQGLWAEVQRAMIQQMTEMTEKRDGELEILRRELEHRQKLVTDLQKSSAELQSRNDNIQSEVSAMRVERQRADHRYQLEMAHVSAQVELVNEFSKKLHDNFRETENLRQQVLQYQDKLSHITSTSGVGQRQIKELREAVTRANDECARLRREADLAKRKGMEAVRRAEELEELRHKDAAAHSASRFPDRQARTDSGSYRSHEPIRPAGQNRPGGSGSGARYHTATRTRGAPASPTPAHKAWLVIKDKIGGIVTGKESNSSRRRPSGSNIRRDPSRAGSASRSSGSNSRSRASPRPEEGIRRSRSASVNSRSSKTSASSIRSGPAGSRSDSRVSPIADTQPYMRDSPRAKEVDRIRAANFL